MTKRRPTPDPCRGAARRPEGPWRLATLLMAAGLAATASARPNHFPVACPAEDDPAALLAGLPEEHRHAVEHEHLVVSCQETEEDREGEVRLRTRSFGVLDFPPAAVRGVLKRFGDYPSWVPMNPSYKATRIAGTNRMYAEVGRSSSRRPQHVLTYVLQPTDDGATWRLVESRSPLEPGSHVAFRVLPHPTRDGASVVIHDQLAVLPESGRMTRYLTSDDDDGRNKYWKDANKHARRTHWALDAVLRHPDAPERFALYVEHYQREFGDLPYWAK